MTQVNVKPHGLFGSRDTLDDAQTYMMDIIEAMPNDERLPMLTGFYVFWNTLALNYDVTLKEQKADYECKHFMNPDTCISCKEDE